MQALERQLLLFLSLAILAVNTAPTIPSPFSVLSRRSREKRNQFASSYVCADPGTPQDGYKRSGKGGFFLVGSRIEYECSNGFLLRGHRVLTCGYNELGIPSWDGDIPQCVGLLPTQASSQPDPCGSPPDPTHFAYIMSYSIGEHVQYRCIENYTSSGGSVKLDCSGGQWRGSPLQCRKLGICFDFGNIANGIRILNGTREGDMVAFRCNNGYELLGRRQQTCGSDGQWEYSWPNCIREVAECGDPGNLLHGTRTVQGTREGSQVEYSCIKGYRLQGAAQRNCLPNGMWSRNLPVCQKITCEPPQGPSHGTARFNSSTYGEVVIYSCNMGYHMVGRNSSACNAHGRWSSPPPSCVAVTCASLRSPMNGNVRHLRNPVFGSVANYTCRRGYGLMGVASRRCQANGTWSGYIPSCTRGTCGTLQDPVNGNVHITSINLGGRAIYSCNQGFVLMGTHARVCGVLGTWTDSAPICLHTECPRLRNPFNGMVVTTDDSRFLSIATYSCNFGYRLIGSKSRQCQGNHRWTGRAPGCYAIRCKSLNAPHNGKISYDSRIVGSEAHYSCNLGYKLVAGDTIRTCGTRGLWLGVAPCCTREEIRCSNLTNPGNGRVNTTTNQVGGTAVYTCDPGLVLLGLDERICQADGQWTGDQPFCIVPCPTLTNPMNGMVLQTGTRPGSIACYSCFTGYVTNTGANITCRTCMINGVWSNRTITCEFSGVDCGELALLNGSVDISEGTKSGANATYSCDTGFRLEGPRMRTCSEDGTWSGIEPTCTFNMLDCGNLSDPTNGTVDLSNGTEPGAIAVYSCQGSYVLDGESNRRCMENGEWAGVEPSCNIIRCDILQEPPNTEIRFSNENVINSTANYSCISNDFRLVGDSVRTCTSDSWTGGEPFCRSLECPVLLQPSMGIVSVTSRTVGSVAMYSCNEGYQLNGSREIVCGEDESWSDEPPLCSLITCPTLSDPPEGTVNVLSDLPGGMAVYGCNRGFSLNGQEEQSCGMNGMWDGVPPTCEVILCPELTDPLNGKVEILDRTVGSQALYTCKSEQFCVDGLIVRSCGGDGNWEGSAPTCINVTTVSCPPLQDPINGRLLAVTTVSNRGTAFYACNDGFVVADGSLLRSCQCGNPGVWSDRPPVCEPVSGVIVCPVLNAPENGVIDISSTQVNASVMFECDNGYLLEGSSERVCMENMMWTGTQPVCNPVDCGELDAPDNGVVRTPSGTTLNNFATYGCNTGFLLNGVFSRFCQLSGLWSGMPPICISIDCGPLTDPFSGTVDTSNGTLFGQIATYSCFSGFELIGEPSRTCLANGLWSGTEPICEVILCPILPDPPNGFIIMTNGNNIVGSIANYFCVMGFMTRPGDVITRRCMENREWSGTEPLCLPAQCPILNDPRNGTLVGERNLGSVVIFSCDPGFQLNGSRMIECGPEGEWSSLPPTCQRTQCLDPGEPTNGRRVMNDFTVGSRVYYIPNDGFESQQQTVLLCQENGHWDVDPPEFNITSAPSNCFSDGKLDPFGRICLCGGNNTQISCCRFRQEWSTLSDSKKERYISAVLTVSTDPIYKPLYQELIKKYQKSFSTLAQRTLPETSQFIPWHRYFLLEYEDLLRLVNRDITIPYWDWSISTTKPYSLPVFDPITSFGNSSDPETSCVTSGRFRMEEFKISLLNGSTGCLRRDYRNYTFFDRRNLEDILSLGVDMFDEFHSSIQLLLNLNIRCFVGGEMCTMNAASDPLYILHLARLDMLIQQWQERDKDNVIIKQSDETVSLVETLDDSLLLSNFSSNSELPYGTCIQYAPLQPLEEEQRSAMVQCIPETELESVPLTNRDKQVLLRICDQT